MILARGKTSEPSGLAPRAKGRNRGHGRAAIRPAFSLLELLIVIVLVSILAGLAITAGQATVSRQLASIAGIVAGELDYARSLAVANSSAYGITFDVLNNRLMLQHTGADASLNDLPSRTFRTASDLSNQQFLPFAELPNMSMKVSLLGAQAMSSTVQNVGDVEFGAFGETNRAEETVVWLTAGTGGAQRYIAVHVNPVTGLTSIGEVVGAPPAGL